MVKTVTAAFAAIIALAFSTPGTAASAHIDLDPSSPLQSFAAGDIEAALRARRLTVERHDSRILNSMPYIGDVTIRLLAGPQRGDAEPHAAAPESFRIRNEIRGGHRYLHVFGADAAGTMYGGLELAEQIRVKGVAGVVDTDRSPYMPLRGTKFNLPLDLRTPSYSDMGDSAQRNIATIWDFEFWRAYLDQLARDRYNMVSVWNLHPFPSMVRVPNYPDVALDDVWRTTAKLDEDYSTRTTDIVTPAMLAQHEVVKRLTIDAKIDFWRRVMQYANDRNIAFYVFTWNIYTYGVDGKYGITDDLGNPKTRDYFRASVREMFRTYPLLAGMGLTAGENMGEVKMYSGGVDSFDAKENWLFATYGQAMLDAARAEPGRRFRLIHRQHESRAQDIAATFAPLRAQPNVDFDFSFKYAQAHALSSTTQTFHRGYLEQLGDLKTFWTIRNDDALLLRWAAPDFVRDFLKGIPHEPSRGFYFGSDMWVWGREYLGAGPPRLEIDKHWLHFLLWGRLGYDPTLDDERIGALVAQRFPGTDGRRMLAAWQDASLIYPLVTGFHWADFDFQWYIEGSRSRPAPAKTASGFHSVETFINQPVHPGTDNIPIPKYVDAMLRGETPQGTTPFAAADRIDARADAALAALPALRSPQDANARREFAATRTDITAMALLGKYYAAKIRGATELAWFRATGAVEHRQRAIERLGQAAEFADRYARDVSAAYAPGFWTNRVGTVDFAEMAAEARRDVDIARAAVAKP
ncbi:MAG TPA: hypothetical protein VMF52_21790 [Steroidobacteraceae bacterium]|nr:hypothetical protein [Steroidobacteraceae bacterium]